MGQLLKKLLISFLRGLHRFFSRKISLRFVAVLLIVAIVGVWFLTSSGSGGNISKKNFDDEAEYKEAKRYVEIKDVLEKYYIYDVDRNRLSEAAASAMVSSLGDNWSYFMTEDDYETSQVSQSQEMNRAGFATIRQGKDGFEIVQINPGSPAELAGLRVGMRIVSIDTDNVRGMDVDEFRTLILARANKQFYVGIDGEKDMYTVNCELTTNPIRTSVELTTTGVITVNSFEAGTGEAIVNAFNNLLRQNHNMNKFIIDLRNNPGGLPEELAIALDYLMPAGEMFVLRDKSGNEQVFESDNEHLEANLCVLVNEQSFGEAEIFAAVLKEAGIATIIGEQTPGRTRIQQTIELTDGGAIRLSTKSYLTPNRVDISIGGVIPDMIVRNTVSELDNITEGNGMAQYAGDPQLARALDHLSRGFSS